MGRKLKLSAVFLSIIVTVSCFGTTGLLTADASVTFHSLSTKEEYTEHLTGITMPYRLYVPENYDKSKSYPLIVFLHGLGDSGTDNQKQINKNYLLETLISREYIEEHPCIIVVPQSTMAWNENEQITVMGILLNVGNRYNIDEKRQIITGFSVGGTGVWNMLLRYPDYFDAAVPIAGTSVYGKLDSIKDIPIWIFHAVNDDTISVDDSRIMYKKLSDIGGKVYMIDPLFGGHDHNNIAYNNPDLYKWLFSKTFPIPPDAPDRYISPAIVVCAAAGVVVIAGGIIIVSVAIRRRKKKMTLSENAEQ